MLSKKTTSKENSNNKKLNPEELSIYQLISDIRKATDHAIYKETDHLDLSKSYRNLLIHISNNDGATQLDISRALNLTAPTISISLRKMEDEGLVTRKTDPNDLRQTRVFLTEKGRKADTVIRQKNVEIEKNALSCLSDQEKEMLKAILTKVRNNVIVQTGKFFN